MQPATYKKFSKAPIYLCTISRPKSFKKTVKYLALQLLLVTKILKY